MVDKYAEQQHPAVCVSSHSEDMPQDVCVSINGSGDLDIWPNDLETSMRVASQVGNLYSEFGYAKPLGSRVICYVRYGRTDGRTDRQTDRQKQRKEQFDTVLWHSSLCSISDTCLLSFMTSLSLYSLSGGVCGNWSQTIVTRDVISGWRRYRGRTAGNIKEQQ